MVASARQITQETGVSCRQREKLSSFNPARQLRIVAYVQPTTSKSSFQISGRHQNEVRRSSFSGISVAFFVGNISSVCASATTRSRFPLSRLVLGQQRMRRACEIG